MKNTKQNFYSKHLRVILHKVIIYKWISGLIFSGITIVEAKILSLLIFNATKGYVNKTLKLAFVLLSVYLLQYLVFTNLSIHFERKKQFAIHKCKMLFYKLYLNQSLNALSNEMHGDAIEKLNDDFTKIVHYYLEDRTNLRIHTVISFFYIYFLFHLSWLGGILLLLISFIQIIVPYLISKFLNVNYDKTRVIESRITNFLISCYEGISTIKLYHLENNFLIKLKNLQIEYLKIGNISEMTVTAQNSMESFVSNILTYGTYGIIGLLMLYQYTDLDSSIQLVALSGSFYSVIKTICDTYPQKEIMLVAIKRISPWFADVTIKAEKEQLLTYDTIQVENISYYIEDKKVLSNISLTIHNNERILIVGENGTGKTTFLKIVTGLIDNYSGTISINDHNIKDLSEKQVRSIITMIPQNDNRFFISARELFQSITDMPIEQCLNISYKLGLNDVILDTKMSELSGGEIKKVYLAIAFSQKADFLFLDEPSNSLDIQSKEILIEMIKEREKGILIVSHDPIFQSICNKQYAIEGGKFYCGY